MGKVKTSWKPGQSGNPGGRRKDDKISLTELLRKKLPRDEFVKMEIQLAKSGDQAARKNIWERLEGRVTETIKFEGTIASVVSQMPIERAIEYLREQATKGNLDPNQRPKAALKVPVKALEASVKTDPGHKTVPHIVHSEIVPEKAKNSN